MRRGEARLAASDGVGLGARPSLNELALAQLSQDEQEQSAAQESAKAIRSSGFIAARRRRWNETRTASDR
jgi:hypothetical protein